MISRYMKIMQERGIVDMQIGEVDHVMDDGSKVYSVTFKPKETQRENFNVSQKEVNNIQLITRKKSGYGKYS